MWSVFYGPQSGPHTRPNEVYLAPSLEKALELAKFLIAAGYEVHEIHGDEGTRLFREIIVERLGDPGSKR
jgi:hypothetical protein